MEGADVGGCLAQNGGEVGVHGGKGLVDLLLRHSQIRQRHLVKARGVVIEGGVTLLAHGGDDVGHGAFYIGRRIHPGEDLLFTHLSVVVNLNHTRSPAL